MGLPVDGGDVGSHIAPRETADKNRSQDEKVYNSAIGEQHDCLFRSLQLEWAEDVS
jgi:hypothetical protein